MWQEIEDRIDQNEQDRPVPLRKALLDVIRGSGLRPGQAATKKMVALEFGQGERLLWEIQGSARNVFLSKKWQHRLEQAGFACELRPYQKGMKDGGRHSALSREWSFEDTDCIALRIDTAQDLRRLFDLLLQSGSELTLNPAAVARWISRLHHFFPSLDRFDSPDPVFDERERDYKLEIASELRSALDTGATDEAIVNAIHSALAKSNLLPWRAYWPMSPKGDADREKLWPALRLLANAALEDPSGHAEALNTFSTTWVETVPQGKPDPARQIAEFLFLHLSPAEGVYIRHTVRQDFWLEAVGSRFPDHISLAETYRDELRFMQAVKNAFEENGLAPRDMIDVQSALWVVHNYKDEEDDDETSSLTRATIEATMDAYDLYRETGEHSEAFDGFGTPRDYWVRSTRQRPDQVYPTKPLVGFIRDKTELNGGWGQKGDAAAQLHNSGFIIIDKDNEPVEPLERYAHLIRDANRVRLCAFNYYIEPARERDETQVSIRAGTLANDLFLGNRMRNVCQALKGEKFQILANVPEPTQTGPNDSTTTTFTYDLIDHGKPPKMKPDARDQSQATTNLILYGPPGTGKTYETAWEAVRLCLGSEAAASLKVDRGALMAEYRRLVNDERIEFVTFHQSLSYEEFVEGLRPSTGDDDNEELEDSKVSAGFRLKCHEGIFKRISERARLDQGPDGGSNRLDRSARVFKMALGRRHVDDDKIFFGLANDLIHLGWGGDLDWADERFDEFDEISAEWRSKKDPEATGHDGNIVMTFSFRADMQVGDYVVVSDGRDRIQAIGRVAGDYFFDPDADFHPHRRQVEWLWRDEEGTERSRFYSKTFRRHSIYKLDQSIIDWDALDEIVLEGDEDCTREDDPSTSAIPRHPEKDMHDELVTEFNGEKFDCEALELTREPTGQLFTLGSWPPTDDGTYRRLAQVVACCLIKKFPQGFDLKLYREALVSAGKNTNSAPKAGWESHNMPTWASNPKRGWLVPVETPLTKAANWGMIAGSNTDTEAQAGDNSDTGLSQYVLIIDEINRANISKVFGELITLLEADKRLGMPNEIKVQLPYSKKRFGVPPNLHIIGTMNTADRSIALLDTALRRRFTFKELMPDPSILSKNMGGINLQTLLTTINDRIEYLFDREHQIGHAYFTGCRNRKDVADVMRFKVIPLLAEYFYEDWHKVAAVLGDGPGTTKSHFLDSTSLRPPKGISEDDLADDKLRWSVKAELDFSEFEA